MVNWNPKKFINDYKDGKPRPNISRTNYTIIILLGVILITSLICSGTMNILCSNFNWHTIFAAKFAYKLKPAYGKNISDNIIKPHQSYFSSLIQNNQFETTTTLATTEDNIIILTSLTTDATILPSKKKQPVIDHLFRFSNDPAENNELDNLMNNPDDNINDLLLPPTTTLRPIKKNNDSLQDDYLWLQKMQVDATRTRWGSESLLEYLVYYTYVSEIVAIIWSVLTITYQCGGKGRSFPNPWIIVLPSMILFFIMSTMALIYTITTKRAITSFCKEIRSGIKNPSIISCGTAISSLRLTNVLIFFDLDTTLFILNVSNVIILTCWILALVIVTIRFLLAIDFQVVEVRIHTAGDENSEFDSTIGNFMDYEVKNVRKLSRLEAEIQNLDDDDLFYSTISMHSYQKEDEPSLDAEGVSSKLPQEQIQKEKDEQDQQDQQKKEQNKPLLKKNFHKSQYHDESDENDSEHMEKQIQY